MGRLSGGEEDRNLHHSRSLQDQDSHKASHESGSEEHLWQGGESCCQACKEGREGLSCPCSEEANLGYALANRCRDALPEGQLAWESHGAGLEDATQVLVERRRTALYKT